MARSAWKQQEIAAREADLLRISRKLIVEHGVQGLTMEKLATATPFSKGTIYQHFRSREDILATLCITMGELRLNMFERASRFAGSSRERAVAANKGHSLLFQLHRELWQAEQRINDIHLRAKLSPEHRAAYDSINAKCFHCILGILRDGIASGELVPPHGLGPEQLLVGMIGWTRGLYSIWASDSPVRAWVNDSIDLHFKLISSIYDGIGWRPFSSEWDYSKTIERVRAEVFPEEYALAQRTDRAGAHEPIPVKAADA
jgi:AcrR family transcriptional regulator